MVGVLKVGTVLTQKCGDDWLFHGANTASISAVLIVVEYLNSKERCLTTK